MKESDVAQRTLIREHVRRAQAAGLSPPSTIATWKSGRSISAGKACDLFEREGVHAKVKTVNRRARDGPKKRAGRKAVLTAIDIDNLQFAVKACCSEGRAASDEELASMVC